MALFTFLVLAGTSLAQAAQDGPKIDFEQLANGYVSSHDASSAISFADVLDGPHYARVTVGGLDLRYPVSYLKEGSRAKEFKEIVRIILEFQSNWMNWKDRGRDGFEEAVDDMERLQRWVKGWSTKSLGRVEGGDAGTLYDQLGANEDEVAAAKRLASFLGPDEETWLMLGDVNRIVFAPDRRHFLELVAFGGWLDPSGRSHFWHDSQAGQPAAWIEWTQVVALEDTPWPVDLEHPFEGASLDLRDKTGFEQRMVDRAAATMLRVYFYKNGTHFFEAALGCNLVIATVGKNDLYVDEWSNEFSYTGETTQGESRFVPGGNPQGGTLPKKKAGLGSFSMEADKTPRWRRTGGENYFLEPLRDGQKDGAKAAAKDKENPLRGDKTAHFELLRVEDGTTAVVSAPFFGPDSEEKPLPPLEFLDDYEEFFRAYRSCFMHWMQERAVQGDDESSQAKFAELIRRQASRPEGKPFHEVVEEVYGVPLSHLDGSVESLEWRFLAWLSKAR